MLQSIRLMFKNVNHIYKYTAITNNTICLLYVINKRVAQLVFKIILRCEKLARYTNLWITDFRTLVLSQNICFLNTTNLNSPLLMKQHSNDFKTFSDKSNQSSHPRGGVKTIPACSAAWSGLLHIIDFRHASFILRLVFAACKTGNSKHCLETLSFR